MIRGGFPPGGKEKDTMLDVLCLALTLLFFGVAVALVRGCAALEQEEQ